MRYLCAMSGGVDSSVAAALLQAEGHEVIGVFMRNGVTVAAGKERSCCSASDARDASRVAARLGIPFYAIDFEREFGSLIDRFVAEYRAGRTPSPCVLCNQELKFGQLMALADTLGAERVATGHYARLQAGALLRPFDLDKDQTYYLFGIERGVLPRVSFPLAELTKAQVRALAAEHGLSTAAKPESMEICFVSGDYRKLLEERGGLTRGRFQDVDGRDLGEHEGLEAYTVGQRRRLPALGEPRYVVEIDAGSGTVVVGPRACLASRGLRAERMSWLIEPPGAGSELRAEVQIRARHRAAPAVVRMAGEASIDVTFDQAQEAVAPGQAVVVYDGARVLGGGWIERGVS